MRLYISCSKRFYDEVGEVKKRLEELGHFVTPPNGWNDAKSESLIQQLGTNKYISWKADMLRKNAELVAASDAVLVLNLSESKLKNYIGGSTFLEAFKAFELGKKLYLYNPIPEGSLRDELSGFAPVVINGDLNLIGVEE